MTDTERAAEAYRKMQVQELMENLVVNVGGEKIQLFVMNERGEYVRNPKAPAPDGAGKEANS